MSEWITWLPSGGWPRFVCDALWQSTLIGMIAWITARFVARRPVVRAWFAIIGLVSCLAVPVASAGLRLSGHGLLSVPGRATTDATAVEQDSSLHAFESLQSSGRPFPQSARLEERRARPAWKPDRWTVTGIGWAAISLILAWRFALSLASTLQLREDVLPSNEKQILDAARRAARRVGVSQEPAVVVSPRVTSPTVFAFAKPLLFIPPPGARPDGELDWYAVFCHELAHLRRRDGWGRLTTELGCVLMPWQPLLWFLRRTYYRACDEACDDWAIAAGANPLTFASTLTEWVPRRGCSLASGAIGASGLKSRIVRLLAIDGVPRFRMSLFCRWGIVATAIVLVATIAAAQVPQVTTSDDTLQSGNVKNDFVADSAAAEHEEALRRAGLKPYRVEPPDIISIEFRKVVPSRPYTVSPGDVLKIRVEGLRRHGAVDGRYGVGWRGLLNIGFNTGRIRAVGMTARELEGTIARRFRQSGERPTVSVQLDQSFAERLLQGEHLLNLDGTVSLGNYGRVRIVGMTRDEATEALERHLADDFGFIDLAVEVSSYNSKWYYVVTQGSPLPDGVHRFRCSGQETVLDALEQLPEQQQLSSYRIWIARPTAQRHNMQILRVDWKEITRNPSAKTNYWLLPGDRVFVDSEEPISVIEPSKVRAPLPSWGSRPERHGLRAGGDPR